MSLTLKIKTIVFIILFQFSVSAFAQSGNGNVIVGSSLTATDGSSLWLSPSGDFAFGFKKLPNSADLFLLGIWYDKIPDKTVVWFANMYAPSPAVSKNSKLQLISDQGLILTDPQGEEIWRSESFVGDLSKGVMSDEGNFLLQNRSSNTLWQSFDHPTNTLLPSQSLRYNMNLVSRRSETNFTRGRFILGMQPNGILAAYTVNLPSLYLNKAYYASNTMTGSNASLTVTEFAFNKTGELYLQRANGETDDFFNGREVSLPSPSENYFRFTLEFDGVLGLFYHPKNGTGSWTTLGLKPDNICAEMNVDSGVAVCGYNSICMLREDENRPYCECPKGFSLVDPDDSFGNCQPDFVQGCAEDELVYRSGLGGNDIYHFEELLNIDWVTTGYMKMLPVTRDLCRQSCLEDCMCSVAISSNDGVCTRKMLPLSSGRLGTAIHSVAFLKVRKGNVTVGAYLTATDGSSPWLSPSGDFAFGFQKLRSGKDLFLLGIWYEKIPEKTVVWFASRNSPAVSKSSKLRLTPEQGLVLTDPQGKEIWRSESFVGEISRGVMSDKGNFLLQDRSSDTLWQSFDHPTDTLLPSQSLRYNMSLVSHRSETNFTRGRFMLAMQSNGDLRGYTVNWPSEYMNKAYYASNTVIGSNPLLSVKELVFNETGEIYLPRANSERVGIFNIVEGSLPSPSQNYFRFTLEFDGVLGLFYHPKNGTGSWSTLRLTPGNICTAVIVDSGAAVCGYNSICKLREEENRPYCECPKGFSLVDPNDSFGNCQPDFVQGCAEDGLVYRSGVGSSEIYDVEELNNIDWVTRGYMQMKPVTRDVCIQSCIEDCMCSVVVSKLDGTCSRKMLPLSSGRFSTTLGSVAYLKVRKPKYLLALPNQTDDDHRERLKEKSQRGLILAGSGLVATLAIVSFLFLFAVSVGFFLIYRKKKGRSTADQTATEIKMRCFSYKELEKATDGFKEELGRGSFGIVYKGKLLRSDSSIPVAVKKLDFARREPEKEFQNEVNVIGQTHHKNLVRLYGLCDDNKNRMIVYEFMNNGTLASYIFGEVKPNWKQRTEIVLGVAKGISYLHEECTSQIIHCDIKPHNILLDESYNVKISDFGLAKLLRMDQSKTHTEIRGTRGYLAPEWFRNMPISTKVDVYSFGVVLLEVICCRKSVEDENYDEEKRILTDWAYDCFKEKAFEALVDQEAEALEDREKLERFTKVSMWCVQESPSMRPMMRQVVQMLEGVVEVLVPPCPCPYALSITY